MAPLDRTTLPCPGRMPPKNDSSPANFNMPTWFNHLEASGTMRQNPRFVPISRRNYRDLDMSESDYSPFAVPYPKKLEYHEIAMRKQEENFRPSSDIQRFDLTPQNALSVPAPAHVRQSAAYSTQLPPSPISPRSNVVLPQFLAPAILNQRDSQAVLRSHALQVLVTDGSSSPAAQRVKNNQQPAEQQSKSTKHQKTARTPFDKKTPAVQIDTKLDTEPTFNSPTTVKSSTGKEMRRISSEEGPDSPVMGPMAKRISSGMTESQLVVSKISNDQVVGSMPVPALPTPAVVVVAKGPQPVRKQNRTQIPAPLSITRVDAQPVHTRSQAQFPVPSSIPESTTTKENVTPVPTLRGAQSVHSRSQAPSQSSISKANTTQNVASSSLIVRGAQSLGAGSQVEIQTQSSASKAIATMEIPTSSLATRDAQPVYSGSEVQFLGPLSLVTATEEDAFVNVTATSTSSPSKEPKCSYCGRPVHQLEQCTACIYCTGKDSLCPDHTLHDCLWYWAYELAAFSDACWAHIVKAEFDPPGPSHGTRLQISAGFSSFVRSPEEL